MARRVGRVALLALIAGGEANLDGVAPYVAAEESGERVARCVAGVEDKAGASVFVVGAHLFGEDPNDPIYAAVAAHGWGAVYVAEPNPLIFDELAAFLARPGTFANVEATNVVADRAAVAVGESSTLPFYVFVKEAGDKISDSIYDTPPGQFPYWIDQISSLNRKHLSKHYERCCTSLLSKAAFEARIRRVDAVARPLDAEYESLEARRRNKNALVATTFRATKPAVVVIDTEGYDCRIVTAHAGWLAAARPALLVFEKDWCDGREARAVDALLAAAADPKPEVWREGQNVFLAFSP